MHTKEQLDAIVEELSSATNTDFYLFSNNIFQDTAERLVEIVRTVKKKRAKGALILTTTGGSADCAYQIARCFQRNYSEFHLYVFGDCKSAGTLVAIAADEIVMSEFGQFGPLDVQLADKKEFLGQTPALEVSQSLATLSETAFNFFTNHFFGMEPGRGINTKAASEIAIALTTAIIQPIASQIDPLLLGRVERSMRIAEAYSQRLEPAFKGIKKLVADYPSHEFVIDYEEAQKLFPKVRPPNEKECELENIMRSFKCVPRQGKLLMMLSKPEIEQQAAQPHETTGVNKQENGQETTTGNGDSPVAATGGGTAETHRAGRSKRAA